MSVEQFGWQDVATTQRTTKRRTMSGWTVILVLLLVAVATRAATFGNPINGLDEAYYFLVGDHMLHDGAIPYVDLWDRKPWGIFGLFAAIRMLGGEGMFVTKVVATLFATATAWIIARLAERSAPRWAALLAGIFYLLMLRQFWGNGPQTPVFYNLFVVSAFWLAIDTAPGLDRRSDKLRVIGAMLLCGLAIQVKTNAVFEGAALGLWLVWRMWRSAAPLPRLAGLTVAMMLAGLIPTIGVASGYAAIGHFPEWWFANVQSQFLKRGTTGSAALMRLWELVCAIAPMGVMAYLGAARGSGARWASDRPLLLLWAGAGAIDMVALGGFWTHYAIPLAVPASILAANAFAMPRWGRAMFAIVSLYPLVNATILDTISGRDDAAIAQATVAAIPPEVRTKCLFIYEGPVAYYDLTHACLVTRFVFTDHLRSSAEANALGEDASVALKAALARQPAAIVTIQNSEWTERNVTNDRIIAAELAAHYRATARIPHMHYLRGREWLIVWRRVG